MTAALYRDLADLDDAEPLDQPSRRGLQVLVRGEWVAATRLTAADLADVCADLDPAERGEVWSAVIRLRADRHLDVLCARTAA